MCFVYLLSPSDKQQLSVIYLNEAVTPANSH